MSFLFKKALEEELEKKSDENINENIPEQMTFHDMEEKKSLDIKYIYSEANKYKVSHLIESLENISPTDEAFEKWLENSKLILNICELTEKLKSLDQPISIESVFYMKKTDQNNSQWMKEWIDNANAKIKEITEKDTEKKKVITNIDSVEDRKFLARQLPLPFEEFNIINIEVEELDKLIAESDQYLFNRTPDYIQNEYIYQLKEIVTSYYVIAKKYKYLLSTIKNKRIHDRIEGKYNQLLSSFKQKYFHFYNFVIDFLETEDEYNFYIKDKMSDDKYVEKNIDKDYLKKNLHSFYPSDFKNDKESFEMMQEIEDDFLNFLQEEYDKRYEFYTKENDDNYNDEFKFYEEDIGGWSFSMTGGTFESRFNSSISNFVKNSIENFIEKVLYRDSDEKAELFGEIYNSNLKSLTRVLEGYFEFLFIKLFEKDKEKDYSFQTSKESIYKSILKEQKSIFEKKLMEELLIYNEKISKQKRFSYEDNDYKNMPGFEKITFKDIPKTEDYLSIESSNQRLNIGDFINSSIFKEFFSFDDSIKLNENIGALNDFLITEDVINLNNFNNFYSAITFKDKKEKCENFLTLSLSIEIFSNLTRLFRDYFVNKIKEAGLNLQNEYLKYISKKEYNLSKVFEKINKIYYCSNKLISLKNFLIESYFNAKSKNKISMEMSKSFDEKNSKKFEFSYTDNSKEFINKTLKDNLNQENLIESIQNNKLSPEEVNNFVKKLINLFENSYEYNFLFKTIKETSVNEFEDKSNLTQFFSDNNVSKSSTSLANYYEYEFENPRNKINFEKKIIESIKNFVLDNKEEYIKRYKIFCNSMLDKVPKIKFKMIIDEILNYYNLNKYRYDQVQDLISKEDLLYRYHPRISEYYENNSSVSELVDKLKDNLNRYKEVYLNSFGDTKENLDPREIVSKNYISTIAYDLKDSDLNDKETSVLKQLLNYYSKNIKNVIDSNKESNEYTGGDTKLIVAKSIESNAYIVKSNPFLEEINLWLQVLEVNIKNDENSTKTNIWDQKTRSEVFQIINKDSFKDISGFIKKSKKAISDASKRMNEYYYNKVTSPVPRETFMFPESLAKANAKQAEKQIDAFIRTKIENLNKNLLKNELGEKKLFNLNNEDKKEALVNIYNRIPSNDDKKIVMGEDVEFYSKSSFNNFSIEFFISNRLFELSFLKNSSFFDLEMLPGSSIDQKKERLMKEIKKSFLNMLCLGMYNSNSLLENMNSIIVSDSDCFNFSLKTNLSNPSRSNPYSPDFFHGFGMFDLRLSSWDGKKWNENNLDFSENLPITSFLQTSLFSGAEEKDVDREGFPTSFDVNKYKKWSTAGFVAKDLSRKLIFNDDPGDSRFLISKECFSYVKEEGKDPVECLSINIDNFDQIEKILFNKNLLTDLDFKILIKESAASKLIDDETGMSILGDSKGFNNVKKFMEAESEEEKESIKRKSEYEELAYGSFDRILNNFDKLSRIKDFIDKNKSKFILDNSWQKNITFQNFDLFSEVKASPIGVFDLIPNRKNLSEYNSDTFNYIDYCKDIINTLPLKNKKVFLDFLKEAISKFNRANNVVSTNEDLLYIEIFKYFDSKSVYTRKFEELKILDRIITFTDQELIKILKELESFDLSLYIEEISELNRSMSFNYILNGKKYKNIQFLFDCLKNSNTSYKNKILFIKSLLEVMHNNSDIFSNYPDDVTSYYEKLDNSYFNIAQLVDLNVIENLNKTIGVDYLKSMIESFLIISNSKFDEKEIMKNQTKLNDFGIKNVDLNKEIEILKKLSSFEFSFEDIITNEDIKKGNTEGKFDIAFFRRMVRSSKFSLSLLNLKDKEISFFNKYKDISKNEKLYDLDMEYDKKLRFRVLRTGDVYILKAGIDTDCCQQLGGVGKGAAVDSFVNDKSSVLLLEAKKDLFDNDKFKEISKNFPFTEDGYILISQSYFHIVDEYVYDFPSNYNNRDIEKYAILDNIESNLNGLNVNSFAEEFGISYTEIYKELARELRKKGYGGLICGTAFTNPPLDTKRSSMKSDPRKIVVSEDYSSPYEKYTDFDIDSFFNLTDESDVKKDEPYDEEYENYSKDNIINKLSALEEFLKNTNFYK